MIEVDVQALVGIAVIVLLALIFYAVVVLRDVAHEVRDVTNRVAKLENVLDDDLTEIHHTLERKTPVASPSYLSDRSHRHGHYVNGTSTGYPDTTDRIATNHRHELPAHNRPRDPTGTGGHVDPETSPTDPTSECNADPQPDHASTDEAEPPQRDRPGGRNEETISRAEIGADPMPVRWDDRDHQRQRASTDVDGNPSSSPTNRGRFVTSTARPPWFATAIETPKVVIDGASQDGIAIDHPREYDDGETGSSDGNRPTDGAGETDDTAKFEFSETDVMDATDGDPHTAGAASSTRNRSADDVSASLLARTDRATIESIAAMMDTPLDDRNVTELFEMLLEEHGIETLQTRIEQYEATTTEAGGPSQENPKAGGSDGSS